ncbi:MAG: FtsL-like putative cell division protein [Cytophagales bacterium]|nr:FtsL-like putative cell division protein [Cytophagales bacterium]MDW8383990.1 FtsL-like putative cell division protein [Flammeovirgaceae bacterium]
MKANQFKQSSSEETPKAFIGRVRIHDIKIDNDIALKYLPRIFYLTFLGVLYIANVHYSEKLIRKYTEAKRNLEVIRVDYSSLKYEYINAAKPSELAKRVSKLGLVENDKPIISLEEKVE